MASLGGPLERQRDPMWILPGKDAAVEVERVTLFRHAARPAAPRSIVGSSSRASHSDCSRSARRPMDAISRQSWHESKPWRTQGDLFHADGHACDRASGVRRAFALVDASDRGVYGTVQPAKFEQLGYGFERTTAQIERIDFGDARGGPRHEPRGEL